MLLVIAFITVAERKTMASMQRRLGPNAKWYGKSLIWDKLSNSGNTLKLLILNNNRKIISGWTNYSYTVISQKINERKMGNRGSKSDFVPRSVKEQRVNGSFNEGFFFI
jgi:hypothetical protein